MSEKIFKNVDVVFIDDLEKVTISVCHGDEFYDVTFSKENCECDYEKGIGEKYSSCEFSTFDEFFSFMKRNFKNRVFYQELGEKFLFEKFEEKCISDNFEKSIL